MMTQRLSFSAAFLLAALSGAWAQGAAAPTLVGTFKDWSMFSYTGTYKGSTPGKICYIYAEPSDMTPPKLDHGRVSFSITTSPSQGVPNESSFVVGYALKDQSPVTVDVDGRKFTMFTEGDSAWMINTEEERKLLEAMKSGRRMTVTAQSRRGNQTTYRYSLDGVTAAADKMNDECQ